MNWEKILFNLQDSSASELGSTDNVSGNNLLSPTTSISPLGTAKVLGGSVETLPVRNNNVAESDEQDSKQVPKKTTTSIQIPETMRNRAASTGSVLTPRRDSCTDGSDEHNRTMLFQVIDNFYYKKRKFQFEIVKIEILYFHLLLFIVQFINLRKTQILKDLNFFYFPLSSNLILKKLFF